MCGLLQYIHMNTKMTLYEITLTLLGKCTKCTQVCGDLCRNGPRTVSDGGLNTAGVSLKLFPGYWPQEFLMQETTFLLLTFQPKQCKPLVEQVTAQKEPGICFPFILRLQKNFK